MNSMQRYLVEEELEHYRFGWISRREFIRRAALIGVGAAAASTMAQGVTPGPWARSAPGSPTAPRSIRTRSTPSTVTTGRAPTTRRPPWRRGQTPSTGSPNTWGWSRLPQPWATRVNTAGDKLLVAYNCVGQGACPPASVGPRVTRRGTSPRRYGVGALDRLHTPVPGKGPCTLFPCNAVT